MAENTAFNEKDYINKMYDASLESQKQGLQQSHDQASAKLDAEQKKAQQRTDANLTRTYVEAEKAQKNYNEVQNAYGLTSGAMAQARLAQDNQLQADLTAIRTAQQDIDAGVERERSVLAKEYAAAIQKAQADNDLQRAQALYDAAKEEEAKLDKRKEAAANLMAGVGDYSLLAQMYGLTPDQLAALQSGTTYPGKYSDDGSGPEWEDEVSQYVESMLTNAQGSSFDPYRVIQGSGLDNDQKQYALAYLQALLDEGYKKP